MKFGDLKIKGFEFYLFVLNLIKFICPHESIPIHFYFFLNSSNLIEQIKAANLLKLKGNLSYKNQRAANLFTMPHIFRLFIEETLFNPLKTNSHTNDQISVEKLLYRLKILIRKTFSNNQLSLSKFATNIKKDTQTTNKTQFLIKNEIFINSLKQVSEFMFKLAYGHPGLIFYPNYNIENVIGFYEIGKHFLHSDSIFNSADLKKTFNQEVMALLFTQNIIVYKDVYYRIEESGIFKNFVDELFTLIQQRIKVFLSLYGLSDNPQLVQACKSHVRSFIEVYQLTDSVRKNSKYGSQQLLVSNHQKHFQAMLDSRELMSSSQIESEEYLNAISIDEIIICFVFLVYRISHDYTNVSLCKILKSYYVRVLKWEKHNKYERVMDIYNKCYLKLFLANRIDKFNKHKVIFDSELAQNFQAELVENNGTILDNFVSSFEN